MVGATAVGRLDTQLSTNNVWSGMLDQSGAGKANFAALHLPLVRIHVGDDGDPVAMPEVKKNVWSLKALDVLVDDVTRTNEQPVMNVKFAPDWMWTCTRHGGNGRVADRSFQTFADYMARLVSYYNKGSLTTETGQTVANPAGTKNRIVYWELWNEPDLSNETPCSPPSGQALTPAEYVTMWNAVTAKMLAVDASLKFIGPATANGQFGSESGARNDYVTQLMKNGRVKPYAISFHGYGYWENTAPDKWLFDGDGTSGCACGGIADIVTAAKAVRATYPGYPIWITEINVNADWGNDPKNRPESAFAAAWWGSAFAQLAPLGVALLNQYNLIESPQFGLLDDRTGRTLLPYWIVKTLDDAFPAGSERLESSSSDADVTVLAARRPDGKVSVLVVDRRIDASNPRGGRGLPADVRLAFDGLRPTALTLRRIDAATSAARGPAAEALPATLPVVLRLRGYSLAIVSADAGGAPRATFRLVSAPAISGGGRVGSTLHAWPARWTVAPSRVRAQWQLCSARGCTAIRGATSASLRLTRTDAGRSVRCVVTAVHAGTVLTASSRRVAVRRLAG